MIMYVTGNLFESPAQVLVNTVNTVGVMGKGVAYEFKRLFPEMFAQYRDLCESGQFGIGQLWLYKTDNKWVLNFPTKKHWRNPSRIEYITDGLDTFVRRYSEMGVHSIAFPPLGCGHGQLDFEIQVRPEMERYLRNLPIEVFIYPSRDDPFVPEHQDLKGMKEWLRSEPTSLPFTEVWEDLVQIVEHQNGFRTLTKGSPFSVRINRDPDELVVAAAGGNTYRIPYDTLLAFWQQLRTHGFSMRHIAPGINRQVAYLIPVLSELPYVKPVRVADRYEGLIKNPVVGLQVLPSAFRRPRERPQLPLFELA